jgi:aminopeptidase N
MKKVLFTFITASLLFSCGTSKKDNTTQNTTSQSTNTNSEEGEIRDEESIAEESEIIERDPYNAAATIKTDLIHTNLKVNFNWDESQLNGNATLTCAPYFYPTDSLILDAKSMEVSSVMLDGKALNFKYNDKKFLRIKLDKEYKKGEKYTVSITYIAKPEEKLEGGSSAISSDKGLYFINPKGENPNQMPQIWTQGETEASSVWFPTIDRPNQKTTQEIFMTVKDKYKTLSNGSLVSSKKNEDGTRTDHWKQDKPHVPYLFMMAVGEFEVIEDSYTKPDGTKMAVNYYVEPEWKEHAQAMFGETPEMIGFFSELLGVDYPWDKYHQVVVREYVSGAMENTGAVIFGDFVYKTKRELIDANDHSIIAHELFHHWFGDLVTCESWANLPLNESFANYSQYLWDEHYYGRDQADYYAEKEAEGYYQSAAQMGHHNMIWFEYDSKEDMFDGHSYNKGGRILHMLRYYLGDEAFFTALQYYLKEHQYEPVEIHHLRLAFEKVSGEDLNWFFNQWFFESHHPELEVSQDLSVPNEVTLTVKQTQDFEKAALYKLPLKVDVYENGKKTRYDITVDKNINTFTFPISGKIENIVFDAQRILLGSVDHDKPREWYIHQFYNAPFYKDREQALVYGSRDRSEKGKQLIMDALEDDFWYIRQLAIGKLDKVKKERPDEVMAALEKIIKTDKKSQVRGSALKFIANEFFDGDKAGKTRTLLYHTIENDSSYFAISRAINGLTDGTEEDVQKALELAEELESEKSSALTAQIIGIYKNHGGPEKLEFMSDALSKGKVSGYDAISAMSNFAGMLKDQDIETQEKYLPVLEDLNKGGSAYVQAILPYNVMTLKRAADSRVTSLESDIKKLEEEGESGEVTMKEGKLKKAKAFAEKVNDLLLKVNQ